MEPANLENIEIKPMLGHKAQPPLKKNSVFLFSFVFLMFIGLTCLIVYVISSSLSFPIKLSQPMNEESDFQFAQFMVKYNKVYDNFQEYVHRKNIWTTNSLFIQEYNKQETRKLTLTMNQFGDLSNEEFKSTYLGYSSPDWIKGLEVESSLMDINDTSLPNYINWVDTGCVSKVKDQGQCGSCWAFSTTGAVESSICIKEGHLYSLSEQELVDCDVYSINMGCNGGTMDAAFQYIIDNDGICTEDDYPYEAIDDKCQNSDCQKVAKISGYKAIPPSNINSLKKAVAKHGPVSVALDGSDPSFRFYQSGVLTGPCAKNLDHAVLVTGYGFDETSQEEYWLVKNSWGPIWGDHGYIKIAMNVMDQDGECGILMDAIYPVV